MNYNKIQESLKGFEQNLNEKIEAEVVGQIIPFNRIVDVKGNIIPKDRLGPWKEALGDIMKFIKNNNLMQHFKSDQDPYDIVLPDVKHGEGHIAKIMSDDREKQFLYNVKTRKFGKSMAKPDREEQPAKQNPRGMESKE